MREGREKGVVHSVGLPRPCPPPSKTLCTPGALAELEAQMERIKDAWEDLDVICECQGEETCAVCIMDAAVNGRVA